MKHMVMAATALMLSAGAAAADMKTIQYPRAACVQILSQEYSTGGGSSAIQYLEILCVDAAGVYRGFITSWGSAAGIIGLGRLSIPDGFVYEPYDGSTLRVK